MEGAPVYILPPFSVNNIKKEPKILVILAEVLILPCFIIALYTGQHVYRSNFYKRYCNFFF